MTTPTNSPLAGYEAAKLLGVGRNTFYRWMAKERARRPEDRQFPGVLQPAGRGGKYLVYRAVIQQP